MTNKKLNIDEVVDAMCKAYDEIYGRQEAYRDCMKAALTASGLLERIEELEKHASELMDSWHESVNKRNELIDRVDSLNKELRDAKAKLREREWRPIADCPADTLVLMYSPKISNWINEKGPRPYGIFLGRDPLNYKGFQDPTHFMPLPTPPAQQEER